MSVKGAIHSIETFGSVDGPGVRFVIFLKGCAMRCQYCHNPDTWKCGEPDTDSEALLKRAMRYRSYWGKNGGITVSGGEPLLQIDFLLDLFQKAKKENIHTVLDTAGNPFTGEGDFFDKFQELMNVTDLILLDLKVYDEKKHFMDGFPAADDGGMCAGRAAADECDGGRREPARRRRMDGFL